MDKLNTNLFGGFPFDLDDWRWEIDDMRRAIIALGKGIAGGDGLGGLYGNMVVYGMGFTLNTTGGVVSISPGWLTIGGELLYWPGGTGNPALPPSSHYFTVVETNDPSGNEVFQDGTLQSTHIARRVKLTSDGVPYTGGLENVVVLGFHRSIGDKFGYNEGWHNVTPLLPGWTTSPYVGGLRYRRDVADVIRIEGSVMVDTPGDIMDGQVFQLPVGYRPNQQRVLAGRTDRYTDPSLAQHAIIIMSSGLVHAVPVGSVGAPSTYPAGMSCFFDCTFALT